MADGPTEKHDDSIYHDGIASRGKMTVKFDIS